MVKKNLEQVSKINEIPIDQLNVYLKKLKSNWNYFDQHSYLVKKTNTNGTDTIINLQLFSDDIIKTLFIFLPRNFSKARILKLLSTNLIGHTQMNSYVLVFKVLLNRFGRLQETHCSIDLDLIPANVLRFVLCYCSDTDTLEDIINALIFGVTTYTSNKFHGIQFFEMMK